MRFLTVCLPKPWLFFMVAWFPIELVEFGCSENSTMKALVLPTYGEPQVLQVQNIQIPTVKENQVLVRVKAAGICPLDAYIRQGTYPKKPTLPCVLGREVSGIVEDAHPAVKAFKKGDHVFCGMEYGGYAEFAAVDEFDCYPLPTRLTFEQGAAIYTTYFTVFRGLVHRGHVTRGNTILIHDASGIIGQAAVEVAKYIGATVVACITEEGREKALKQAGADHVIYRSEKNYLKWILTKINRLGFNMIFELFPNFDLEYDKLNLAKYGRIVVLGNRVSVMESGKSVFAVSLSKYTKDEQNSAAGCILSGIENGVITPIVSKEFKFEEGPDAHHHMRRSSKDKIIFVI